MNTTDKYIDAHCHVFNQDVLSMGIRVILHSLKVGEIARLLEITHIDKLLKKIDNLIHFIDIGLNNDTEGIYKEMQDVYKKEYMLTPLMLDLTYVSGNNKNNLHKSFKGDTNELLHMHLHHAIKEYTSQAKKHVVMLSATEGKNLNSKLEELESKLGVLESKLQKFGKDNENLRLFGKHNFDKQLKHLKELKMKHPDMVYPFLSVDPHKKDILDIVKKEVGPGKNFIGIKLYAPCGYSPTDPLLYGKSDTYTEKEDCLYNFCLKNDIPITAHNSDSGFATFNNSVKINGYIYQANTNIIEKVDKVIQFKKQVDILKFKFDNGWIEERAMILNHPKIWQQVLKKFPKLRLNLAHFGGSGQLKNFISPENTPPFESYSWSKTIFDMLSNPLYPNFYTDLSCFDENDGFLLKDFKQKFFDKNPDVQDKILYGSDFYLNMIFSDSFNNYLNMFKKAFDGSFDKIAKINSRKFLNISNL